MKFSDLPDIEKLLAFCVLVILGLTGYALAGLSDGVDPTDMQVTLKDARAVPAGGGVVVLPPIRPGIKLLVTRPLPLNPKDTCDLESDCERTLGDDCDTYGYVGLKNAESTQNLIPGWCTGECSGGCNINGCPQVFRECADEEPEPEVL